MLGALSHHIDIVKIFNPKTEAGCHRCQRHLHLHISAAVQCRNDARRCVLPDTHNPQILTHAPEIHLKGHTHHIRSSKQGPCIALLDDTDHARRVTLALGKVSAPDNRLVANRILQRCITALKSRCKLSLSPLCRRAPIAVLRRRTLHMLDLFLDQRKIFLRKPHVIAFYIAVGVNGNQTAAHIFQLVVDGSTHPVTDGDDHNN